MKTKIALAIAVLAVAASILLAQQPVTLTVNVDRPGVRIDPIFYGLMNEEINFSYDGGLYAELIRNRALKDNAQNPVNWSVAKYSGGDGVIALDKTAPVPDTALTVALKLDAAALAVNQRVGVANEGYWGIPVRPDTTYRVSFFAKAGAGFKGPLTVALESNDGSTTHAKADVSGIGTEWKKYSTTLKTGKLTASSANRFVISTATPGTLWFTLVSLFPPTYKNRPNGLRPDIMQLLAEMKPSFLRFPGGNYLEGSNFDNRFNWKATIGPIEQRPTHLSPWNYRSSDGMGVLEFLEWCEDLNMEPLVGVYAGLHIDRGANIITGDALKPHVQDALDEIEYITGDAKTTWGARRAKDGHPAPFKLRYVEVGNEDWLNNGTASYDGRLTMFTDAIKAKYPNLKIISTMRTQDVNFKYSRKPDMLDDHFYMTIPEALTRSHMYDNYDRSATKVFVGEWATNKPQFSDTPLHAFALADAAFLTGLERNADVVVMNAYAPLFVNTNPGGRQWAVDLIGYNALVSFGSPSYYVQKMFSNNRGDVVLPAKLDPLPRLAADQIPIVVNPNPARGNAAAAPAQANQTQYDGVYAQATRETSTSDVILKLVNVQSRAQTLNIDLQGVTTVRKDAVGQVLTGELTAVNTVSDPMHVVPKPVAISNASPKFSYELPAHSVTVLRLKTR